MSTVTIHRNFFKQQSISQTHFRGKSQIKMKRWRLTEGREPRNFCGLPLGLQGTVWETLIGHSYCTWVGHWKFIWGWSFDHKGHWLHRKGADLQLRPPKPLNSLLGIWEWSGEWEEELPPHFLGHTNSQRARAGSPRFSIVPSSHQCPVTRLPRPCSALILYCQAPNESRIPSLFSPPLAKPLFIPHETTISSLQFPWGLVGRKTASLNSFTLICEWLPAPLTPPEAFFFF